MGNCFAHHCWIWRYLPHFRHRPYNYNDFFCIWNSNCCASCWHYYGRLYGRNQYQIKNRAPAPTGTRPKQYRQRGKAVAQYRPQGYCTTKTPRCIVSCTYFGQRGVFFMSFFTFSTVIFTGVPRPEMIRASSAYIFTASIAAPPFCCIHTRAAAAVCGRRHAAA